MTTIVTKTVKPSGGDYTSLAAWEAAQQGDLVAADQIRQAECYAMSDTTQVAISGSTTDATRYLRVFTPVTERHDGKWNAAKYRLEPTDVDALTIHDEYVRLEGLQLRIQGITTGRSELALGFISNPSEIQIDSLIIRGSGANSFGIDPSSSQIMTVKIRNTIIYDCQADFFGGLRWGGAGSVFVYNCTFYNNYYGVRKTNGSVVVKNCLAVANVGANFHSDDGVWGSGTDYNVSGSSDITTGAHCRTNQTVSFVDATNRDLHLTSTDAGAKDFGVDLSSDIDFPFSTDIDGETRAGSWDVGADEFVAVAGPVAFLPIMARRRKTLLRRAA